MYNTHDIAGATLPKQIQPWERQAGETPPAWEAFQIYREMEERTYESVARKLQKSGSLIRRWGSQWNWQERCLAYDRDSDRRFLSKVYRQRVTIAERHLQIARSMHDLLKRAIALIDPAELRPADIWRWMETIAKIERQALGVSLNIEYDPVAEINREFQNMSQEELLAEMKALGDQIGGALDAAHN